MRTHQQQRLCRLRFFLYDRPLHPELFEIYHDHHVVKPAYDAQIWVTGCTHVIGFYHRKTSLVEVTADAAMDLPVKGRLLELPFRGEKDYQYKSTAGVNYMMNFQVETMSPSVFARTHHELARLGMQRGLFVPLPALRSRSLTPFSYIDYQAKANELHVFSFHALSEDLTIVKTQSIFELA